jgi:ABC-type polysaccharide/polyol phosphate export permease
MLTNLLIFFYIARVPEINRMGVLGYSIFVFSGLLPYRVFHKSMTEASGLLITNMEMLKNAIFPLPFLGTASLGAILFEFLLQIIFLLVLLVVSGIGISWHIFLLPVAMIPFSALILGCTWIFSIIGYLLKDIQEVINVTFLALVYITPTMYPPEVAPGIIQNLIEINPLTHMIIVFRDVWTPGPSGLHIASWIYFGALSLLFLTIGFFMTKKARKVVGDLV